MPIRRAHQPQPIAARQDRPAAEERRLGSTLEFMRLVWALDHGLQATSKRMQFGIGVTGPQRLVLRLLGRFRGVSAGRLARLMHVHPSTLTGILERLESRGLIVRWPDPCDARRALLGLGAAGERLNRERAGTVENAVRTALASLPPHKVDAAKTVLAALIRGLGVEPAPGDGLT